DTALGDLLTQPHHEHGARHEGGDSHEVEAEVSRERYTLAGQTNGHANGLHDGQHQGAVAGVLADLATASFTFLLQLLQLRTDSGHELHDDRRRDVRHDPQGKDAHALQRAAGKHVEQAKNGPLILAEELRLTVGIDPGNRDMRANSVDDDRQEQEAQPSPELGQPAVASRRESTLLSHLVLDLTASCFDSRARTLGSTDTLQGDSQTNLARQHDLHTLYVLVDDVGILQRLQGHDVAFHLGQLGSAHFSTIHGLQGYEAELRQTTVQRLLTTLEAGGDAAAGTGSLTLV